MPVSVVQCLFCDDIREEIGGKLSYMGVYADQMAVPTLPFTVLMLSIQLKLQFTFDVLDMPANVVVDLLGEQHSLVLPLHDKTTPPSGADGVIGIYQLAFTDIVVEVPGKVVVSFEQGDERTVLGELQVVGTVTPGQPARVPANESYSPSTKSAF